MRLFALAASLRAGSLNRKLLHVAAGLARDHGAEVDVADFSEFTLPYFDADLQARDGIPEAAQALGRRLLAADGMLLASPEYNFSLPGHLKNTIDWLSRIRPVPIRGKSALLLSASTGPIGGIRGLWQLRIPLEGLGMHVHPDMYIVPHGNDAFTPDGGLKDLKAAERLDGLIRDYVAVARALAGRER